MTKHTLIYFVYLAGFLKKNPAKFASIWVEKGQKAGFFAPEKAENHTAKEKERKNWKSEEKKKWFYV